MTVKELFDFIKGVRPGFAFNDAQMMVWLNEIEGKVQTDIMLLDPAVSEDQTGLTGLVEYDVDTDMDTELIVPFPWNKLYRYFMLMSIDLYNGEYQRYGNSFAQFNEAYEEYAAWYAQNIAPANGLAVAHGYYLTAYQFAVKGGFIGTVEDFCAALGILPGLNDLLNKTTAFVTPQMFGAKGDGVTDDTTAFQNALSNTGRRFIFVPNGTYLITRQLRVPSNITIVGETKTDAVIYFGVTDYESSHFLLRASRANGITLYNLTLRGYRTNNTRYDESTNPEQTRLYGFRVDGQKGTDIVNREIYIDNCIFDGFSVSAITIESAKNVSITNSTFEEACTNAIAITQAGENITITGNSFHNNSYQNINFENEYLVRKINNIVIENNYFSYDSDRSGSWAINISAGSKPTIIPSGLIPVIDIDDIDQLTEAETKYKWIRISGNIITGVGTGINISFASDVSIQNNILHDTTTYGVYVHSSNSYNVEVNDNGTVIETGITVTHNTPNIVVSGNNLDGTKSRILVQNANGVSIENNNITDVEQFAIRLGPDVINAIVSGNITRNITKAQGLSCGYYHYNTANSKYYTITNNVFSDSERGVYIAGSDATNCYVTIKGNRFMRSTGSMTAVHFNTPVEYIIVEDNTIHSNVTEIGGTPGTKLFVRNNTGFANIT